MRISFRGLMAIGVLTTILALGAWYGRSTDTNWHHQMMMLTAKLLAVSARPHLIDQRHESGASVQEIFSCDQAIVDHVAAKPFWVHLDVGEERTLEWVRSDLTGHTFTNEPGK